MKRCALICAVLLSSTAFTYAANPNELWQDYQKNPGYVSTAPTKPAQTPSPHVTVEADDGKVSEPTTPQQAKDKAEVSTDTQSTTATTSANEETPAQEPAEQPATTASQDTPAQEACATAIASDAEAQEPANETVAQGDSSVFNEAAPQSSAETLSTKPVIGNKPVAPANKPKPKPILKLVGKPPLPKQFMRTPQAADFTTVTSASGGYSIALPGAFGTDPLAALPQAEGAMCVRTADDDLMCAVTMLDAADTLSYNSTQALPQYENKHIYWQWQHDAVLTWDCTLSSHNDYHGDKMLLEAHSQQSGKAYQMLFVMPKARFTDLLPQAIYALNSFKFNS